MRKEPRVEFEWDWRAWFFGVEYRPYVIGVSIGPLAVTYWR